MDEFANLFFDELKERVLLTGDLCEGYFKEAFERIRSSVQKDDPECYRNWNSEYGEGGL